MIFFFGGHERWRGWWQTPNQAGAFVAVLAIIATGICISLFDRWRSRKRNTDFSSVVLSMNSVLLCLFLLALILLLVLLSRTYSRGGWAAFLAGALVLWASLKQRRLCVVGVVCTLLLCGLFLPSRTGVRRMLTSIQFQEDRSIGNRLLVWRGALQMLAEHPWYGVGVDHFGSEFMSWYQSSDMETAHITAVNDYLTVGAERGLPFLGLILTCVLTLIYQVWLRAYMQQCVLTLSLLSAAVAFMVACMFSSLLFQWRISAIFYAIITILTIYWFRGICLDIKSMSRSGFRSSYRYLISVSAVTLVVSAVVVTLWLGGCLLLVDLPTRHKTFTIYDKSDVLFGGYLIEPRNRVLNLRKGKIFYLPDCGERPENVAKAVLRPLAVHGWTVVCFPQPMFRIDALKQATTQLIKLGKTVQVEGGKRVLTQDHWMLVGHGQGAGIAIILAANTSHDKNLLSSSDGLESIQLQLSAVACMGVTAQSPFAEVSPLAHILEFSTPLLLFHARDDASDPYSQSERLRSARESYHLPCYLRTIAGDLEIDGSGGRAWTEVVDKFCSQF